MELLLDTSLMNQQEASAVAETAFLAYFKLEHSTPLREILEDTLVAPDRVRTALSRKRRPIRHVRTALSRLPSNRRLLAVDLARTSALLMHRDPHLRHPQTGLKAQAHN
jgi:hypothetical protein